MHCCLCMPQAASTSMRKSEQMTVCLSSALSSSSPLLYFTPASSFYPPLSIFSLLTRLYYLSLPFSTCRPNISPGLQFHPTPLSPPCSTRSVISEGQAYVSVQARAGVHCERKPGATVLREFHLSKTARLNYFVVILGFALCFGSMLSVRFSLRDLTSEE